MVLDCRTCGACCHGDDGWVHVSAVDEDRVAALGALVVHVRVGTLVRRALRMHRGACAALEKSREGTTCTVYDVRPTPCRDVEPGDAWCLEARRRLALS